MYGDSLVLGGILAMQLGYTLIVILGSFYLELVLPGKYGVGLPFYFPFMVFSIFCLFLFHS